MAAPKKKGDERVEELAELYNSAYDKPIEQAAEILKDVSDQALEVFVASHDRQSLFIGAHALMRLRRFDEARELLFESMIPIDPSSFGSRLMHLCYASLLYLTGDYQAAHAQAKPFESSIQDWQDLELYLYPFICLEAGDDDGFAAALQAILNKVKAGNEDFAQAIPYLSFIGLIRDGQAEKAFQTLRNLAHAFDREITTPDLLVFLKDSQEIATKWGSDRTIGTKESQLYDQVAAWITAQDDLTELASLQEESGMPIDSADPDSASVFLNKLQQAYGVGISRQGQLEEWLIHHPTAPKVITGLFQELRKTYRDDLTYYLGPESDLPDATVMLIVNLEGEFDLKLVEAVDEAYCNQFDDLVEFDPPLVFAPNFSPAQHAVS